jgi:hypothetical protein
VRFIIIFVFLFQSYVTHATYSPEFMASIQPMPQSVRLKMQKHTWHQGCPLPLPHLAYVHLSYWGFDNQSHVGSLIVHKALITEVVAIFKALYQHHFPIQRLALMDEFHGDDMMAMKHNVTSAFNCREVTGQRGLFSQHSYGRAIDINPLINPYVSGKHVLPKKGMRFVSRAIPHRGKITKNSFIYHVFTKYGWDWGGGWFDAQDYQHFEKRAHGERRNPYGYGK